MHLQSRQLEILKKLEYFYNMLEKSCDALASHLGPSSFRIEQLKEKKKIIWLGFLRISINTVIKENWTKQI